MLVCKQSCQKPSNFEIQLKKNLKKLETLGENLQKPLNFVNSIRINFENKMNFK